MSISRKKGLNMTIIKKRTYNSTSRKMQAKETQERIISSAQTLFEAKGFEKVTIEEIAQAALVSVPTIYGLFQSKIGILRTLTDKALAHEDFEELVRTVDREKSPAKRLALSAKIARQIYDAERTQIGIFHDASILDAELKKLEHEREKRRYQRQERTFKEMAQTTQLAKGLTLEKAHDILWALTGRDLYRLLVIEQGWSSNDYELWLADALKKLLLQNKDSAT